ncbi:hypothetical protein [Streptosporangium sp. NBC_01469]|uniref:hypothetical protein n=1 Tax=Streptosporangium sp. NBC_01469 TaxID=2903898 RepID=UPI002E28495B|nr:hypothetical protein [Streptosporangium sp. NBC_01469]
MPDKALSLPEITALLVLMVEAREISNPELQERHGLTITGDPRRNLNELKLVESRKGRRGAFVHVLTDAGWACLTDELRAGIVVPERSGSAGIALRAVLSGVQGFMERTDHSLADVFAENPDPAPAASSDDPASTPAASPDDSASTTSSDDSAPSSVAPPVSVAPDVEERIRAAYRELAAKPGAWVSLTKVRPLLGEVARATVDEALVRMNRMPDVNIVPESNQKTLSREDRDAAVTIGAQEKHLLWIEAR